MSIRYVDGLKGGGVASAHSTHDTVMVTLFNRAGTQRLAGILACPVGQGFSLPTVCGREIVYRGVLAQKNGFGRDVPGKVRCIRHGYGVTYGVVFPAGKTEKKQTM